MVLLTVEGDAAGKQKDGALKKTFAQRGRIDLIVLLIQAVSFTILVSDG